MSSICGYATYSNFNRSMLDTVCIPNFNSIRSKLSPQNILRGTCRISTKNNRGFQPHQTLFVFQILKLLYVIYLIIWKTAKSYNPHIHRILQLLRRSYLEYPVCTPRFTPPPDQIFISIQATYLKTTTTYLLHLPKWFLIRPIGYPS